MGDTLEWLLGAASFVPHGYCLLWRPDLVALHAASDAATALAYFSIPVAILVFCHRRRDLDFPALTVLFAAFILGCGLTHVADILTLWWPIYGAQGLTKAATAIVSVISAVAIWRLLPAALALPSPAQLRRANQELSAEVARRAAAEVALAATLGSLEAQVKARTQELADVNERLLAEIAERTRAEDLARQGEQRAAELAERLRLAVEATELGIWDVDAISGERRWSDELKRVLGLPPECQPSAELFSSMVHPADRERVEELYLRAHDAGSDGRYRDHFRILRSEDGDERWVEATGRVHFSEAGQAARSIGTLKDITKRRRTVIALQESEERYRALIETGPDAVLVHRQGEIILANRAAADLFGAPEPHHLLGRSLFELVMDESLDFVRARIGALQRAGERIDPAELVYRRLDGTPFAVEAAGACVQLDGRLVIQSAFRDVTERRRTEQALQARTAELETVLDTVPISVWIAHDNEGRRITGNRAASAQLRLGATDNISLGAPEGERPRHFRVFREGVEVSHEHLPMQRAARGEVIRNDELRVRFEDGTFFDELINATPVRDRTGKIIGAVGAAVDITERKSAEEQIRHLALHDPLTQLPNRTLFNDRLAQAVERARRRHEHVAVMLLDLDRFKAVNDALGHHAGDALLKEVALRLGAVARSSDTWARLGGDEFALVQEGLKSPHGVAAMALRVLGTLRRPFRINGQELDIAGSLGLTIYPEDGESPQQLLHNADIALYRAKSAGRGRFEPYRSELERELRRARKLERELRQALENDAFELVYQPVFELPRQRLIKTEALVRLRHADGSRLPPGNFIPQAESSGLIHPLGEWVLRAACRQGALWQAASQPLKIAVNVSAVQLRGSDFPLLLQSILDASGLPAALLELELDEAIFLDGSKTQIHATLQTVAEMGVTLAIDDFGTGYSSLAHLRHFPFHEVKIDRSFVADIGRGTAGGAVVAAVIGLAHSLRKHVTAEGVETLEQLEFLREHGCDAVQGHLLARPAPAAGHAEPNLAVA